MLLISQVYLVNQKCTTDPDGYKIEVIRLAQFLEK